MQVFGSTRKLKTSFYIISSSCQNTWTKFNIQQVHNKPVSNPWIKIHVSQINIIAYIATQIIHFIVKWLKSPMRCNLVVYTRSLVLTPLNLRNVLKSKLHVCVCVGGCVCVCVKERNGKINYQRNINSQILKISVTILSEILIKSLFKFNCLVINTSRTVVFYSPDTHALGLELKSS